ncbi:MAG: UDP-N-acetylmuramoyl-tripeptide--D-alanyl-D-alanine ligase [Polaribacter sp.]|jgi:UDP-N-acetylmuramoyl-tripeptide--D-alanyl-D-alanine ligase
MMQLSQVSVAVNGELLGEDLFIDGAVIDSRADCTGKLFVALDGDNFDGHNFLTQAENNGAVASLIEKPVANKLPQVLVGDSHQALQDLAAWWRAQFVIPVIGITGSVGKTSVKEMLACIFAEIGKGLVTQGNLNNEIGVPLTLMRLEKDDTYAIVEMGMNHAGEISRLSQISKPTVALINNAAAAHLEGLGTIQAVAKAKGEIFEGLSEDGVAVINSDDPHAGLWLELIGRRKVVTFGLQLADVSASYKLRTDGLEMSVKTSNESFDLDLPLIGQHNVRNTLAAIAVAVAANIPCKAIIKGLSKYRPIHGRLNVIKSHGITLIDDTYNANPASMRAAIETLAQFPDSTLILGDMGELGEASIQEHLQLGKIAQDQGIGRIYACGEFAQQVVDQFRGVSQSFAKQDQLLVHLSELHFNPGAAVLVKGSRFTKMENVVEYIQQTLSDIPDAVVTNQEKA